MKRIIPIIAIVAITSCHNANKEAAAQNEIDSMKMQLAVQHMQDSMNAAAAANTAPAGIETTPGTAASPYPGHIAHDGSHHYDQGNYYRGGSTSGYTAHYPATNTYQAPQQTPEHKKGWSSTAKGAVIGAGVGALSGALIDRRKGQGAILGGLIGAGTGAGTGLIIDKSKKHKENNQNN